MAVVGINIGLTNGNPSFNPNHLPLIVIGTCNATNDSKDLEGFVWGTGAPTAANIVTWESGTDRLSITFVVPWGFYYQVRADLVEGAICTASVWLPG